MRNQNDSSFELFERFSQSGDGFDVQVICRFVEHQQVRHGESQLGESDSRLLTARKNVHLARGDVTGAAEAAENAAVFFGSLAGLEIAQRLDRIQRQVEVLDVVLCEIGDSAVAVVRHVALCRLQTAEKQLEQRRFTGAVFADNRDPTFRVAAQIDSSENLAVSRTVTELDIVHLQESSVDSLLSRRVEAELDDLWRLWRVKNGQFFENLDLGLDLSSAVGVVAEAIDEDLDVISKNGVRILFHHLDRLLVRLFKG